MAENFREKSVIESQEKLASDVYSMWLNTDNIAGIARPGQFISVYAKDGSRLLPRPISICEIDGSRIRIVYRILGQGTLEFSEYQKGDTLDIQGPLGNGYQISSEKAIILGGGIGIPPMLELAKQLKCEKEIILGYRDELFLHDEFVPYGNVYIATEDGSCGTKGNVLDVIREHAISGNIIYACGPKPMLKAIKEYAQKNGLKAYISMEERMACGIGACLACVCKSSQVDDHSRVHNKRVCKEGPVFRAEEVEF